MIYTSDNQVYEDATAHALDMPKDLSQKQSTMPRQAPTEPTGEFKSEQGTQVASESKTLYIIRHGATDMNAESNVSADRIRGWTDIPLNDEGRQDAEKAGQKLAGMDTPTVMHHSDLDRAAETAQIIGKHVDVPTQSSRALRPWDLGTLTGKSTKEAIPEIEDYVRNKPDQAVPKGESFNEFKEIAFKGIHAALDSGDSPVAVVTHHRLERLLEAWDKKGQPADHSIDLDTFIQKGDPPGGIKTLKIAMNDNAPKGEMNLPNISGGLSTPPKPANDNDPRKPFKGNPSSIDDILKQEDYDRLEKDVRTYWQQQDPATALMLRGVLLPKTGDLEDVEPSKNIERRTDPNETTKPQTLKERIAEKDLMNRWSEVDFNTLSKKAGVPDIENYVDKKLFLKKAHKILNN